VIDTHDVLDHTRRRGKSTATWQSRVSGRSWLPQSASLPEAGDRPTAPEFQCGAPDKNGAGRAVA
jgi:hypothetical protein